MESAPYSKVTYGSISKYTHFPSCLEINTFRGQIQSTPKLTSEVDLQIIYSWCLYEGIFFKGFFPVIMDPPDHKHQKEGSSVKDEASLPAGT